nr:MAG TPA: hypothetical protein [Caudoviricetes sp.]
MGEWCQPLRRLPFTVSVHPPFILLTFRLLSTHVSCLLATGFLGRKHPFVLLQCWCVSSHFSPCNKSLCRSVFVGIATNGPCCSSCDGMGSVDAFGPVCYTRVDESSKTICGVAAEEP